MEGRPDVKCAPKLKIGISHNTKDLDPQDWLKCGGINTWFPPFLGGKFGE